MRNQQPKATTESSGRGVFQGPGDSVSVRQQSVPMRAAHNRRLTFSRGAILFLIGVVLQLLIVGPLERRSGLEPELRVHARISAGSVFEIFLNGDLAHPYRVPIEQGKDTVYTFRGTPREIRALRIDPTNAARVSIEIFEIVWMFGDTVLATIPGEELRVWPNGALAAEPGRDRFSAMTTGDDPVLVMPGNGFTAIADPPIGVWAAQNLTARIAVLGVCIIALIGPGRWLPFGVLLAYLVFQTAGVRVVELVLELAPRFSPPPVNEGIGSASFHGIAKSVERYAFLALTATMLLFGVGFGACLRIGLRDDDEIPADLGPRRFPVLLAAAWGIFAVVMLPPFTSAYDALARGRPAIGDFDWRNIFAWDFFAQRGLLPYRDYWFPYSGDTFLMGGLPPSLAVGYLWQLVLAAGALFALFRICDRKPIPALGAALFLGALCEAGLVAASRRYLACGIGALLTAQAFARRNGESRAPLFVTGLWYGWMLYREPSQLLYLIPATLLLAAVRVMEYPPDERVSEGSRDLLVLALGFGSLLLPQLTAFAVRGQLFSFVTFYTSLSGLASGVAVQSDIRSWFAFAPWDENVLFASYEVMVAIAVASLFRLRDRESRWKALTFLAVVILCTTLMMKQLLRPHMAKQLFTLVAVGAVASWWIWARSWRAEQWGGACLLAGFLFVSPLLGDPLLKRVEMRFGNEAGVMQDAAKLLAMKPLSSSEVDHAFDFHRYSGFDADSLALIEELHRRSYPAMSHEVFIFGDEGHFYPFLNLRPCIHTSLWNMGGAHGEREVIECLERHPPSVVIWNREYVQFDGVPNLVRAPLLSAYIIDRFVPEGGTADLSKHPYGRFELLKRRAKEPFPWEFWRATLGSTISFGRLPELVNFESLEPCDGAVAAPPDDDAASKAECAEFLRVAPCERNMSRPLGSEFGSGCARTVTVRIGDQRYSIDFKVGVGKSGFLPLSRFWFWRQAQLENAPRTILRDDGTGVADEQRILSRWVPLGQLY